MWSGRPKQLQSTSKLVLTYGVTIMNYATLTSNEPYFATMPHFLTECTVLYLITLRYIQDDNFWLKRKTLLWSAFERKIFKAIQAGRVYSKLTRLKWPKRYG